MISCSIKSISHYNIIEGKEMSEEARKKIKGLKITYL